MVTGSHKDRTRSLTQGLPREMEALSELGLKSKRKDTGGPTQGGTHLHVGSSSRN